MSDVSSRRRFLIAAGAATVTPILPLAQTLPPFAPQSTPPHQSASRAAPPPAIPDGYESLGAPEATFVEAMVNVMGAADSLPPNGIDCGLATFIGRRFAGAFLKGGRYHMPLPGMADAPRHAGLIAHLQSLH